MRKDSLFAIGGTLIKKKRIAKLAGYFQITLAIIGFLEVEKNVDGMGYHIHLLINTYNTTRDELAWALNIKPSYVPYYEEVDSQVGVSNYVTKMFNDLCHISEKKECTREHLAYLLDIKKSHIQYYKSINSKSAVSGYVLKNMKADQIHYNFHI